MDGFEPSTSPLPRVCSTPELHEQNLSLERAAGIEPASSAWKAEVLPLNYARLPALAATTRLDECGQTWWRGKDSNLRSFRGRFTVCSLWPLGNPSNWRSILPLPFSVSSDCFTNLLEAWHGGLGSPASLERDALCQSSMENASPARIFSSGTRRGTVGAPDIRPARSAAVSGKQASSPP